MSTSIMLDPAWKGDAPIPGIRQNSSSEPIKGNWPRLLKLDEDTENRLREYIDNEVDAFYRERQPLMEDWKRWQEVYWAAPATKEKNFPFKRAANIVVPLAAISVEAFHARVMNTLFSVEPFWSIRPRSAEWITAAKPFENFLQAQVENGKTLRLWECANDVNLELTKLGTAVVKTGYERVTKKTIRNVGGQEEIGYVTTKNGANVARVPLGNFIQRLAELDPQSAPLVGEEHEFTWSQMKRMSGDGRMRPEQVEKIKSHWVEAHSQADVSDGSQLTAKVDELTNFAPSWYEVFKVLELWITFDVDGDGWDEEIVVDYHKASRTFLSIRYNWYDDLHRPYRIGNLFNVEGIWAGIGLCKQSEQFQEQATTIHRQRLDNATLANMSQLALRKNMGYGPGEPIFPGKMWFVDDPTKDIREFKLSDVYNSAYANEEAVSRLWEKRTGINEMVLGIPHDGTPAPATSDLTRLAEGNKKFDLALKNIRKWWSEIGLDVVTNYQIFGDQQVHFWIMDPEDAMEVERVLNMPATMVRDGAVIDLTVSDSITNREVEKQQWLGLFQVITNYYDRVLALAQLFGPEIFGSIAQKAVLASDEALRRLLETFAIPDSDRFSLIEEGANDGQPSKTGAQPPGSGIQTFPIPVGAGGNGSPNGNGGSSGRPGSNSSSTNGGSSGSGKAGGASRLGNF